MLFTYYYIEYILIKDLIESADIVSRKWRVNKMMINKVGDIQNILEPKKTKPALPKEHVSRADSATISVEGKQAAEFARNLQMVKGSPDIRADKIRELKEKISDGTYDFDNKDVINDVAGKITSILLKN